MIHINRISQHSLTPVLRICRVGHVVTRCLGIHPRSIGAPIGFNPQRHSELRCPDERTEHDVGSSASPGVDSRRDRSAGTCVLGLQGLSSAVELKLFAVMSEAGSLDAEELRERLGLHPRSARDFFDALVALGMLARSDGRYSNTA